jgi:D-alanyl-D-alanine carboxypeptidase
MIPGHSTVFLRRLLVPVLVCAAAAAADAQTAPASGSLAPDVVAKIETSVRDVLAKTGVPSASVGIAQGNTIVFTAAYGNARLDPPLAATPDMKYPVGSISKQFTAACVLLLQEEGSLSVDDPIAKFFPGLTRASDVRLRHVLSHTSGYRDYAPQDYTIPAWTKPTTPERIVQKWATMPLDFEPGTQYQYSNTNFNIAGLIVQKASGEAFWSFLSRRVLRPLGMTSTVDLDRDRASVVPVGYKRYALGPPRPAIPEAPGWYFADGQLAMTAADLLKWDVSLMNRSLLAPASYAAMETEVKLASGAGTRYGLGVTLTVRDGHRLVSHSGEVGGFVASNMVYPDDKLAIAVLTNQDASPAATSIGRAIAAILLPAAPPAAPAGAAAETARAEAQARQIIDGLRLGQIERTALTDDCSFYFDATALEDHARSLGPLGGVKTVTQTSTNVRGGLTFRAFDVTFADGTKLRLTTYTTADGKLEQFILASAG